MTSRAGLVLAVLVLVLPLAAGATGGHGKSKDQYRADAARRMLYATDSSGNLLRFRAKSPERIASKAITGLPSGVVLKGIDFRPATGDLYALGSDKVVYRINPWTAIAVAEGRRSSPRRLPSSATVSGSTSTRPWTRSVSRATRTMTSTSTPIPAACSRRTRISRRLE
jgi:hypothetical protein